MPWFRFEEDFDHKVGPLKVVAYKAGMVQNVTTACAKAAEEAGVGKRTNKPKEATDGEDADQPNADSVIGEGAGDAGS